MPLRARLMRMLDAASLARVERNPEPLSTESAEVPDPQAAAAESWAPASDYVDKGVQLLLAMRYRELASRGERLPLIDVEFRNHSQTGEDGILHYVMSVVGTTSKTVVEMCAGTGVESNSANLIVNHGFHGVLFDGDLANIEAARHFYRSHPNTWMCPPRVNQAWISAENVNELLIGTGVSGEIDLFCLDMDGVDYWVWKALEVVSPRVVMLEIQAAWMCDAAVTVPYSSDFVARWVTLGEPDALAQYAGASLPAFVSLAREKGYRLIGGNRFGFNVVFLRSDVGADVFPEAPPESVFTHPTTNANNKRALPYLSALDWESV